MSALHGIADISQRLHALEPSQSFIVQAPAGSGKTELLIQRYLMLLSHVGSPEEITAITFTRKAAAEMRQRVLQALSLARDVAMPEEAHRALTCEHARRALEQDERRGWNIEDNPGRLRIQTIDALCASLTRQMPVLSAFGAQPESIEDASALYREAARNTLARVEDPDETGELVARLLSRFDNNTAVAEDLVASMLARRDHWLRNVAGGHDRETLEATLRAECRLQIERVIALWPQDSSLCPQADAPVQHCRQLADSLLTQAGTWRKHSSEAQALSGNEPLRLALHALRRLPEERYSEEQWEALSVILRLLPIAVAELKVVFARSGQADFVEIAQRALDALGEPEAPTDLMLALDYRIHHLLVDEFQDTSFTQYRLLEKLTEGWEPGDGRTLFLVGDPMQSIYRFREAEVGLFLKARSEGIGGIRLEPLTLSVNFRSQADIVDWVNRAFAEVMPGAEDITAGAVPYSPSEAVHAAEADGVSVHAFFNGDREGEAAQVATLVRDAQAADPEGSIAVLVRSRGHLEQIVPALKQAGLRFRAIEIEPLGHRQAVQDLLALTRALLHPADRLAWLAVLRAPWCGLTLSDLHGLAAVDPVPQGTPQTKMRGPVVDDLFPETLAAVPAPTAPYAGTEATTVWALMNDETRVGQLSEDGQNRVRRIREILGRALADRLRGRLRERVEGAWLALGGPACVHDDTDLEDAEIYLDCLEQSEAAGDIADPAAFEEAVAALFALPDLHAQANDVQILTIHKAKGLEFDTVIVPGLGCVPRRRDPSLLLWMERPAFPLHDGGTGSRLLLAPIRPSGTARDAIYDYIVDLDREKESHEDARLLYVAATRARKHLHLLGETRLSLVEEGPELKAPGAGSLLERLWPVLAEPFEQQAWQSPIFTSIDERGSTADPQIDQYLRRLPSDWMYPEAPAPVVWTAPTLGVQEHDNIEFSWAGELARHVGSVVHGWLQRMAEDGLKGWHRDRLRSLQAVFRQQLAGRGIEENALDDAAARVAAALRSALEHERGRWLLGPHPEARNEYRIAALIGDERRHLVVDRMFIDEQGVFWIVDYKTSVHEGGEREAFLDRERERYRAQLELYRAAVQANDDWGSAGRPTRLGLYFPLLSGWREWPASA